MAVKIRLARRGRNKMPIYDIVVADARAPRDGRFIEKLGQYNPHATPAIISLKDDRALYWLQVGAQPTDTTRKILSVNGVMFKKHLQIGVDKGAVTQEQADARYETWSKAKEEARTQKIAKLNSSKEASRSAAFDAERKKKEDKVAAIKKAEADLIAASAPVVEEEVVEEVVAEETAVEEVVVETLVVEQTPVVEAVVEVPAVETPVVEAVVETPAVEVAPEAAAEETPIAE
jgi:small subunit ribosomal protein S16